MTPDEIRAAVSASPELLAHAQAVPPNTVAIAAGLSAGRTKWRATEIGKGTILEVLGLAVGNALCDLIDNTAEYRHVKHLLIDGRLRLDSTLVRATLASLVGVQIATGVTFTATHRDDLLALALQADIVDEFDVRVALLNNDGTLKV